MPKSRNREKHKQKVQARRKRLEQNRKLYKKKLQELYGEEVAKQITKQQIQNGEEPEMN